MALHELDHDREHGQAPEHDRRRDDETTLGRAVLSGERALCFVHLLQNLASVAHPHVLADVPKGIRAGCTQPGFGVTTF